MYIKKKAQTRLLRPAAKKNNHFSHFQQFLLANAKSAPTGLQLIIKLAPKRNEKRRRSANHNHGASRRTRPTPPVEKSNFGRPLAN